MNIKDLSSYLSATIMEEPPLKIEHGNVIREGVSLELDEWREIASGGKKWMLSYQEKLIKETNISTLKIKYTSVFGYFIEVSSGQKNNVPDYFIRKQTLTNVERFTTQDLIEYQGKILIAEEEVYKLESKLFQESCRKVLECVTELQEISDYISEIDILSSFGELAIENKYCKPEVLEENILDIKDGRHPVIETFSGNFIPNDSNFDYNTRFILLSGPNMSGKSTYLRQNAIIIYLAHIGCFVPANSARIGLTDRIFTRVGAGDNLSANESTFMMEMMEASTIIHNATERSFIIFDELGRGTSTYDGLSIAWAISEYLHDKINAKTIFATHYHELCEAMKSLKRAKNYSVAVIENESQGVLFLHKIVEGGTDKSYGIEVARLAGIPKEILFKAKMILKKLESTRNQNSNDLQMSLFNTYKAETEIIEIRKESEIEKKLKDIDINRLTPLQALIKLEELKIGID